jgi:hypothetical protein
MQVKTTIMRMGASNRERGDGCGEEEGLVLVEVWK